jgi:type I restriction enzyme, S subunit
MPRIYKMFSNGIRLNQWRLEPEHFENLLFFLPPIEEQNAIVANINEQMEKLDGLKSITEKTITLLQERRTALISSAVTGKLNEDVLNAGIGTQTNEPTPNQVGEHHPCLI